MATVTIAARSRENGKSYVVQYVDPETGQKRHHATFRRRDMAQQEANKLRILLDAGEMPEARRDRKRRAGQTFNDVADLCQAEWTRRGKEGSLRPATIAGYENFLRPLRKHFGAMLMATIDREHILNYRADVAAESSKVYANRQLFILKSVFAKALESGSINKDEVAGIRYLSETAHERKKYMRPAQLEELLAVAGQGRARHYLPLVILLAVEHGASRQELLDLQWRDIDFDDGETGIIRLHRTKTNVTRVQRLMPRTREALLQRWAFLQERRRSRRIAVKGDYVVSHLDGSRMGDFKQAWKQTCAALGLEDFHFHDNRHTFCSNILMAGGTLKHAKEMIGHKTLRMTDRYSHLEGVSDNPMQAALAAHYSCSVGLPASPKGPEGKTRRADTQADTWADTRADTRKSPQKQPQNNKKCLPNAPTAPPAQAEKAHHGAQKETPKGRPQGKQAAQPPGKKAAANSQPSQEKSCKVRRRRQDSRVGAADT